METKTMERWEEEYLQKFTYPVFNGDGDQTGRKLHSDSVEELSQWISELIKKERGEVGNSIDQYSESVETLSDFFRGKDVEVDRLKKALNGDLNEEKERGG